MPTYRELAESIYEDYKLLRNESKAVQDSNSPAWNPIDGGLASSGLRLVTSLFHGVACVVGRLT